MIEASAKAHRIWNTMQTEGWPDILAILNDMTKEPQDELYEIMVRKPETLTGRTAIAKANRCKALLEFQDELNDLVAPLNPRKGQGG